MRQLRDLQMIRLQHFAGRVIHSGHSQSISNLRLQKALLRGGHFCLGLQDKKGRAGTQFVFSLFGRQRLPGKIERFFPCDDTQPGLLKQMHSIADIE